MQFLIRPEESLGSPGTEVTDSSESPCGGWELNLGPPTRVVSVRRAINIVFSFLFSLKFLVKYIQCIIYHLTLLEFKILWL